MKTPEQQIESVALMMAAAYWRGRLEYLRITGHEQSTIEAMIKAAASADRNGWKIAAKLALGDGT